MTQGSGHMLRAEETPQNAEHKQAFLKFLPKRLETLVKRGRRLLMGGWDINALNVLFQEVQTLAGAAGRYGLVDIAELLFAIEVTLAPSIEAVALPDDETTEKFSQQLAQMLRFVGREGAEPNGRAAAATKVAPIKSHVPLMVTPPNNYWQRWASATMEAPVPEPPVPEPLSAPAMPASSAEGRPGVTTFTPAPKAEPKAPEPPRPAPAQDRSIYHLTDGNELAAEIDRRLAQGRLPVEPVEDAAELIEVIGALTPAMVIVDAAFIESIDRIGDTLRLARSRSSQKIGFVVFTESNDIATRLRAMRAGVDAFIVLPAAANDVMARIQELVDSDAAQPFRVLIIEDDRSQALFAESILRKAGMETRAVMDPLSALEELDTFDPELILIDLYMPGCDGLELTTLIREREGFAHVPIVFLSGEHDEEKRFDALSAGGDDYLEKPIRPKHLISAVTNRVRRARGTQRRPGTPAAPARREDAFGLSERSFVIERLTELLATEDARHAKGGVLFMLIEGAHTIREKIGLTAFDALMGQVSTFLAGLFPGRDFAARYGDTTFFALVHDLDEQELLEFATRIRQSVDKQIFEVGDRSTSVALSVGISAFQQNFGEAGAMLNAAERACALARKNPDSRVAMFQTTVTRTDSGEDAEVAELLREAIRQDQLQLLFQPIASLRGSGEEQFQAFARLRADGGRMYSAGVIVPLAERNGLIHGFDRWTLTRCLMVIADRTRDNHPIRLFASQSIDCINDPQRPAWLKAQIEARQVNPANLVIELRTADAAARVRQVTNFAEAMRTIGVKLCLNSFESTMGNFQLLQHVPADFIKLSSKYTSPEGQTPTVRAELRQTITHVRERGTRIIAPQVEDAQCAAALWSTGVDYIQGDFVQQATQSLDFDFAAAAI